MKISGLCVPFPNLSRKFDGDSEFRFLGMLKSIKDQVVRYILEFS